MLNFLKNFLRKLKFNLLKFLPSSCRNFLRVQVKKCQYRYLRLKSFISFIRNPNDLQSPLRGFYTKTYDIYKVINATYIKIDKSKAPLFVVVIPEARVLYDYGVCVTPNHYLLGDVSPPMGGDVWLHDVLFKSTLPSVERVKGNLAVISSHAHQRYFHWMFDILPRLEILEKSNVKIDYLLLNSEKSFQKESIEVMKLNKQTIISPQINTHIIADHLVVPCLPSKFCEPTLQQCSFLRRTFMQHFKETVFPEKKIYISRSDALTRRVINEEEIIERLLKLGFEIYTLEGQSIVNQALLFAKSSIIVAPHGAGLTYIVFCKPNTRVIEFMPDSYRNPCFSHLSSLLKLKYSSLACKTINNAQSQLQLHDHFVNLKILLELIGEN